MNNLELNPGEIKVFNDHDNFHFCLVTNSEIEGNIFVKEDGGFKTYKKYIINDENNFEKLLSASIPEKSCIVVISPYVFFQSPPQEMLNNRRLIAMACNSTPTSLEDINHFWKCVINTDHIEQQKITDNFFSIGERAKYLKFIDYENETSAIFNHLQEDYLWSEQTGIMSDGEQQLAPSGEISVLPLNIQNFDETLRLNFNGSIALHGTPILHNGTPSFTRDDQKRMYSRLNAMSSSAIIADIKDGEITNIKASTPIANKAVDMMQSMFDVDSRYRILWEIGFAINKNLVLRDGNHAMNETYGGPNGTIHFGLGLTPYTQYHLDIVCQNMNVLTDKDFYLIGPNKKNSKNNSK